MRLIIVNVIFLLLLVSCEKSYQPKPKAYLALEYPEATYKKIQLPCPYTFEINKQVQVKASKTNNPCWVDLEYPDLKGTIFITYRPVHNNLQALLMDGQKLPLQHTIKADEIEGDTYVNAKNHTYGTFYEVKGDAASQAQFYLTDSVHHFLTGSIYFKTQPNYDSIIPAADYLANDIRHIMETVKWADSKN
ncbi:gliding motility lipoprotein GldD [Mesonia aestuariivivens]|uniref:Gliding motility lipoprotein GldD n=1 Tax=Mesonia aestuariivivens TaxID=2796128 RepID=A0ABS6VXQ3_9FLAO|nr:gliding motility lipoprotein GldD [Mesonia aestuariivivens]MBW2960365.1 gliding motility lipoprotein GldD [Mesonia aestuariivivens]